MLVAVVLGASGAVGRHVVQALIDSSSYHTIYVVGRRTLNPSLWQHSSSQVQVHQLVIGDFANMEPALSALNLTGSDVFVTLGTTMRQAGSKAAFMLVDYTYVLDFARICRASNARALYVLTSMGAAASASNFYLQVKGKLELALSALNYPLTRFFRPSILLGRPNDGRLVEFATSKLFTLLGKYVVPATMRFRPIEVDRVAKAMVQTALNMQLQGVQGAAVVSNQAMLQMTLNN